ncbi:MAG: hypothetical protein FJ088_12265, partial [Deltaproteobacteria bacterium]|nr:hypothetical protein [Deltaproteobacteria bacterium]
MRFSLGTKIFLLMSALVLLFGATSFLILSKMDSLWENLWYVREQLNPSSNEMTRLAQTMRAIEESLENKPLNEADMARGFLVESGFFLKTREVGAAIEKSEAWSYLTEEETAQIRMIGVRLSKMIFGNHFYLNIIETGKSNEIMYSYIGKFEKPPDNETLFNMYSSEFLNLIAKKKFEDAAMLKNEILRMATFLKKEITAGNFEVLQVIEKIYRRLAVEKGNAKMTLFSISAFALVMSILALFMSVRVLKPVKDLIMAVRTVGSGTGAAVIPSGGTDEIADLA